MKLKKRSVVAIASICSMLVLSGCDSQDKELNIIRSEEVPADLIETEFLQSESIPVVERLSIQSEPMPVSKISSELSAMGAVGAISSMIELTAEQEACLNDFDKYFAVEELENYFDNNYSAEELKKLNNYFDSELGQKAIRYSSQQIMQVFGGDAPDPSAALTEAEVVTVAKMSQDPTFVKYNNFSLQQGNGSLQQLIKPLLIQQLDKCNLNGNNAQ